MRADVSTSKILANRCCSLLSCVSRSFLTSSPNLCSHVLAAVYAAQLKHENVGEFPAGFRNPNRRRAQLASSRKNRNPKYHGVSLLAKYQPVYTWADVQQTLATSPKDFMPAGIGEKKPKEVYVYEIGWQGKKPKKRKQAAAAAAAAATMPAAAPFVPAAPANNNDADDQPLQAPPAAKRRKKTTKSTKSPRGAVAAAAANDDDDEPAPPPPPIRAAPPPPRVRAKDLADIAQNAVANPAAGRASRDRRKRELLDL